MSPGPVELRRVLAVLDANTNSFSELAKIAGLEPDRDFCGADLRNVDFGPDNLSQFTFRGADLRGANFSQAAGLRKSMFVGARRDETTRWPSYIAFSETKAQSRTNREAKIRGRLLDQVRNLLDLAGWQVESETRLQYRKVDLLVHRPGSPGRPIRIAIETKERKSALHLAELHDIVADARSLIDMGQIDEFWIIASLPLSHSGAHLISQHHALRFFTLKTLMTALIDSRRYLADWCLDYERWDGQYYVPLNVLDDHSKEGVSDLQSHLTDWALKSNVRIATVMGASGSGKTTAARYFMYTLVKRFAEDGQDRVPIYVSLDRAYAAPNLSELISSELSKYLIPNFSYALFRKLNALGSFVLIVDDLDHVDNVTIIDEFIRELGQGAAKILLLGRVPQLPPHRGSRKESTRTPMPRVKTESFVLADFNDKQARKFVSQYSKYLASTEPRSVVDVKRLQIVLGERRNLEQLMRRPIFAKMLVTLSANLGNVDTITIYDLYDFFLSQLIDGSFRKRPGQISTVETRKLLREIAWWAWTERKGSSFALYELPKALSKKVNLDWLAEVGILSEADQRGTGGRIRFPHRSVVEFLVAEHVVESLQNSPNDIEGFSHVARFFTAEIVQFVLASRKSDVIARFKELAKNEDVQLSRSPRMHFN